MDYSHLPDELKGSPWLALLSRSHYISILLDPSGRVQWIANASGHYHQEMVNLLGNSNIQQYYNMPEPCDLNDLFREWMQKQDRDLPDAGRLHSLPESEFSYLVYPFFDSRNIAEQKDFMPGYIWNVPLSRLYLIRLNKDRFIGLVHFPNTFIKWTLNRKRTLPTWTTAAT